jgi:hypothetical protein
MSQDETELKNTASAGQLERSVVRQILEREIKSQARSSERNAANNALEAAYQDDLMRRGLSHALFVLAIECGV